MIHKLFYIWFALFIISSVGVLWLQYLGDWDVLVGFSLMGLMYEMNLKDHNL